MIQNGNVGHEQHLVFECLALQEIRDRYNGVFGDHVAIMVPFMWQHDTRAVAQCNKEYTDAHGDLGPLGQAPDQPQVAGNDVKYISLPYMLLCNSP